jgi:zinc protease
VGGLRGATLVCALAIVACTRPAKPPTPSTDALAKRLPLPTRVTTLKNGLKVVVQEDHRNPSVAVNVTYHVGSAHDPPARGGLAHLFEHLMFEGSKHVKRGEFDLLLKRAGATNKNATTSHDVTTYYETVPAAQLELALFLESDRMGFLLEALDQQTLESVRAVVRNEYRQRYENTPYGAVTRTLFATVFPPGHPYHRLPIGSIEELDATTLEDLRSFFLRWYGPNNATLTIVGDVGADDAIRSVKRWFEAIPSSPPVKHPPRPPRVRPDKETRLTFAANVKLPKITMMWPAPAYDDEGDVEMTSASSVVSWGLYGHMVKKIEAAHTVSVGHIAGRFAGMFIIDLLLREGITMQKALEEIDDTIDDISRYARWLLDEESVHDALYNRYADEVFELDGTSRRAETLGFYDVMSGTPTGIVERLRAFERISESRVVDTYRDWILRTPRVVAYVQPDDKAPPGGQLKP